MSNATSSTTNPLLLTEGIPPFDKIRPEHVVSAVRESIAKLEKHFEEIEKKHEPTWKGLLELLSELERPFMHFWAPVGHLMSVRDSEALREAHRTVQPEVVAFSLRAGQSRVIYDGLVALRDGEDWEKLEEAQQRIVDDRIRSMEQAGVALEGEAKERFNEIAQELSRNSTDFSNHLLDATKSFSLTLTESSDVEGFPESLLQLTAQSHNQAVSREAVEGEETTPAEATPESGPWRITLDQPIFIPFMRHCRNRELREQVYRSFITRASQGKVDNNPILVRTLELRQEQAGLLGYDNYADLSLSRKMAPDVQAVDDMSEEVFRSARPRSEVDHQELCDFARKSGESRELVQWDLAFWSERLREDRFGYTDEQLRPYFPLPRVVNGLFGLCERLFGITISKADGEAPIWHEDVRYFRMFGEDGEPIASFFLDAYSRPQEKQGGAWMNVCLERRVRGENVQLPIAYLCCNGTPPVGDRPSLMTFSEVETLFHEFGHGLQHMLTRVNYAEAAGVAGVEWDAVEIASQFMENWCYHKPTLMGMTSHVDTEESLPEELFEKICAARTYRSATQFCRQLELGWTDLALHHKYDPGSEESPYDVHARIAEKTSVLSPLPEGRFLCGFAHIFAGGYAAGYYSYLWSLVLASDVFGAFEEAGLDDEAKIREVGKRYRETILACGGGRDPMSVFQDFRGRKPTTEAFLRQHGLTA
ncbi:MAG: M3 family metallopeptidase [Planctomycetota bacterium]|jgi:oligopeptidase A|nr:M3 family metallopeptidase [Planctomycetota bacterium]